MRTHGTLAKWNEDRGFGFIAPAQGGDDLFVHISAFPRDGARPQIGELISFEVESAPDGKKRAVRSAGPSFRCDGRQHCSQMRSCAEATYFIRHCPNTQMDGNNDGVPCEQQWCN